MKLIDHIIRVDLDEDDLLIINSLNGLMDVIRHPIPGILEKWQGVCTIEPETEFEKSLYDCLAERGYLMKDEDEEVKKKQEIIKKLRDTHHKKSGKITHITFIITYDCNFACPYCFEANVKDRTVITNEQINAALALAGDSLVSIGLFGGEPLLPGNRKALEHLFSKIGDVGLYITTNGYYLEDFFYFLNSRRIVQVMVTLDGEEDTHNSRRYLTNGGPTFHKIISGVRLCLENAIDVCIRMNVNDSNLAEAKELRERLIKRFEYTSGGLTFEMGHMLELGFGERNYIASNLLESDSGLSIEEKIIRNRMYERYSPIVNSFAASSRVKPTYSFCYAHAGESILVDPMGHIFPCLVSVGIEALSIGTYHPEVNFKESGIHTRNIDSIAKCRECKYALVCGGGCPLALKCYKNLLLPDCSSIHNQIHNMIPKIHKVKKDEERHTRDRLAKLCTG